MSKKFKIKKGDKVFVITGKDKGKTGDVLSVLRSKQRVMVQGINIAKKHKKATQENPGKIEEKEASIHISNVSLIDPDTGKPTRVTYKTDGEVKKRVAVASGSFIDS